MIAGGGPAGAATAIALRNQGIPCTVLEAAVQSLFKPGETLPPNAGTAMGKLGLNLLLEAAEHHTCTNNTVVWSSDKPETRYFFAETNGNGWHLDRPFFERQLKDTAVEKGVTWRQGWKCEDWTQKNNHLELTISDSTGKWQTLEASFIVDASGRSSSVAKKAGVKRHTLDRLTGYYAELTQCGGKLTGTTFIEAVAQGWWYASPMKNGNAVINFMTDADLHQVSPADINQWMIDNIRQTKYLNKYFDLYHPDQLSNTRIKPASTSYLESPSGDRWLAVGDALCTYDPITSYGITAALGGGLYAAFAIGNYLKGNSTAMEAYTYIQQQTFNNYLNMLQNHYNTEKCWKENEFWKRRYSYV